MKAATEKLLPCPFCGKRPSIEPKRPDRDGDCFGVVECRNKRCPAMPSVRDGSKINDDRGSAAYIAMAIRRWNKRATQPALPDAGLDSQKLTKAEQDVLAERASQRIKWGDTHDDEHDWSIKEAAICYAQGYMTWRPGQSEQRWPWEHAAWKPRGQRENIVRATAMLIAELDRMDRAAIATSKATS